MNLVLFIKLIIFIIEILAYLYGSLLNSCHSLKDVNKDNILIQVYSYRIEKVCFLFILSYRKLFLIHYFKVYFITISKI